VLLNARIPESQNHPHCLADSLSNVGVGAASRKKSDWHCAREFWMKYFAEAGVNLREYSLLRETTTNFT